jgi:hypothetical protein
LAEILRELSRTEAMRLEDDRAMAAFESFARRFEPVTEWP